MLGVRVLWVLKMRTTFIGGETKGDTRGQQKMLELQLS
jgi:hypothetical protein